MITDFRQIMERVQGVRSGTLAVAVAQDADVLRSVREAANLGIVSAVLIGDELEIHRIARENHISLSGFSVVHEPDKEAACAACVKLVRQGKAQALMKGLVDTSAVCRAVLNREWGLRKSKVLSHVAVFSVPGFNRFFYITDAAINILPDLETKKEILANAVEVARALGNPLPRAACVCAVEKVNPKMPATLDGARLMELNRQGWLPECRVTGPLALDNAISVEAARHKGITDPDAGQADILLMPQIETGNVLYKSLALMARAENAGVIVGAAAPVVVTSRAETSAAKLNSIALAAYLSICSTDKRKDTDHEAKLSHPGAQSGLHLQQDRRLPWGAAGVYPDTPAFTGGDGFHP